MLPASPVTVMVPVMVPAAAGVTEMDKVPDCPAESAIGKLAPERLNCEFEIVACVMLTGTVPEFVTVTVCVVFFPTGTVPKFTLVGFNWKSAAMACDVVLTMPAHPLKRSKHGTRSETATQALEMRTSAQLGFIELSNCAVGGGASRVTPLRAREYDLAPMRRTGGENKRGTGKRCCSSPGCTLTFRLGLH